MFTNFPKKKVLISIIGVMIFYMIFVILSDVEKLFFSINSMKLELIPAILGIQFISFFFRSIRQRKFLKKIGFDLTFKKNFIIFLSGLSMLMTPGGTGSAIKLQFLKNEFGYQRRKTLPIVFYERYHDFLAIITIMIIFSFFYSVLISQILIGISISVMLITFVILRKEKFLNIILEKFGKIKFVKKFLDNTIETKNSLISLISIKEFVFAWIVSIVAVMLDLVAVYLIFDAIKIKIGFIESSLLFLTSIIAGLFSFLPAGIGVTELSFLGLLSIYGIEFSLATAVVLVIRFLTLWFSTIVGFITMKFVKF